MKTDMRTRAGREEEIRERVKKYSGFTSRWIAGNAKRAAAADAMLKRGEMQVRKGPFPWNDARMTKPKTKP
jgi:hypothetical protein